MALSIQGDDRSRGPGRGETLGDHVIFLLGYAAVYVLFVVIQTVVFNAHRTGKGGSIDFLMVVCAIPFLIGFVPAWWLSRYACAGRSGWARHCLVGIGSGLLALGIAYALILGGII